jgi:hypothetical protein
LALYWSFSSGGGEKFAQPANGKQGPVYEKMSQIPLTNKKQGKLGTRR